MIVRSAILEGTVRPEDQGRFDAFIADHIVALMQQFPGVRGIRVLRAETIEDDGPSLYMTFESTYDSIDAMNEAFKSPVRQALRDRMKEIFPLFNGRLFHINQQVIADVKLST